MLLLVLAKLVVSQLIVESPEELKQEFSNGVIKATLGLFGSMPLNETLSGKAEFMNSTGCRTYETSLKNKYSIVERGSCYFVEKALFAQEAGALGVVVINSDDRNIYMGVPEDWQETPEVFALIISATDGETLRNHYYDSPWTFGNEVELSYKFDNYTQNEVPVMQLALTGINEQDSELIESLYKVLGSLSQETVDLRVYFNYIKCSGCENFDKEFDECLSGGRYCLLDPNGKADGSQIVLETVRKTCLLSLVKEKQLPYSKFFLYLKSYTRMCKDYSEGCSNYIIERIGVDYEEVGNCVTGNIEGDNIYLDDHQLLKENDLNKPITASYPILIANESPYYLDSANIDTFLCLSFTEKPLFCEGYCSNECPLEIISDSFCQAECGSNSCLEDFEDCYQCSPRCLFSMLGDGICQEGCNNEDCNYDFQDCREEDQSEQSKDSKQSEKSNTLGYVFTGGVVLLT